MAFEKQLRRAAILALMMIALTVSDKAESSPGAMAPVDVNRATVMELMTIPGMTEVWAKRIVRFRPYRRKTDLVDHGVVSATEYEKIRDYVVAHRAGEVSGRQAGKK